MTSLGETLLYSIYHHSSFKLKIKSVQKHGFSIGTTAKSGLLKSVMHIRCDDFTQRKPSLTLYHISSMLPVHLPSLVEINQKKASVLYKTNSKKEVFQPFTSLKVNLLSLSVHRLETFYFIQKWGTMTSLMTSS